jgi:hypothetical protein
MKGNLVQRSAPAATPDAYVDALTGWRARVVRMLRAEALAAVPGLEEKIKWGHLVYFSNGPAFLIRAEESRVLFGFWRGKRMLAIEPRLAPGGKYEMATLVLDESASISRETTRALVKEAVALNRELGDPTKVTK